MSDQIVSDLDEMKVALSNERRDAAISVNTLATILDRIIDLLTADRVCALAKGKLQAAYYEQTRKGG
jgi:CRISPR/Cas system CSM-associated protein Csm2 small subunit